MKKASPFTLPPIAIGTAGIAGNPQDKSLVVGSIEQQAEVVSDALLQCKIRKMRPWIDTALHYGAGNALKSIGLGIGPKIPKDLTLSIKVGRYLETPSEFYPYEQGPFAGEARMTRVFDYSAPGVMRAFDQSFKFLNHYRKDKGWKEIRPEDINTIVFVHDPEQGVHGEKTAEIMQQVRKEALPTLQKLKEKGEIKAIGLGCNEVACANELADAPQLDLIMVAGRLTLMSNENPNAPDEIQRDTKGLTELLEKVKAKGKQFIAAAPGQSGILYPGGNWYNYRKASDEIMKYRDDIEAVCNKHSIKLTSAALNFPLLAGASAVVAGPSSPKEVAVCLDDFHAEVKPELWKELEEKKLINPAMHISGQAKSGQQVG